MLTEKAMWNRLRAVCHAPASARVAYKLQDAFAFGKPDAFFAWRDAVHGPMSAHVELKAIPRRPVKRDGVLLPKLTPVQFATLHELAAAGQVALVGVGVSDVREVVFVPIARVVVETREADGLTLRRFRVPAVALSDPLLSAPLRDADAIRVALAAACVTG